MKKLVLFALILTLGLALGTAKDKKAENVKTTVFTADIHCENCSIKIMDNVPALGKGIKDVEVNVEEKTVTVTYDSQKNNDDKIIKGLKSLNVNAQPIQPSPTCDMCPASSKQKCCAPTDTVKACCQPKTE